MRAAGLESWYTGTFDSDDNWPSLEDYYDDSGRPEKLIASLDESANKVVAHTPRTNDSRYGGRGLVVGYVQSGKTMNFTAVAAKAADVGYRLVIVLSGMQNSLRKQTQARLDRELVDLDGGTFEGLTDTRSDFHAPEHAIDFGTSGESGSGAATYLIVAKKNQAVLRRLIDWLGSTDGIRSTPILVIDDEADQASVRTKSTKVINEQIRSIVKMSDRCTYIGYTATPFANVFIDPDDEDDLYPRDFILSLPKPDGYFGPEALFGRFDGQPDSIETEPLDVVRFVDDEDLRNLVPSTRDDIPDFKPVVTGALRDAVDWFLLATAIRRVRGIDGHSSMLIHTHVNTDVHEKFRAPLNDYLTSLLEDLGSRHSLVRQRLRRLLGDEQDRVTIDGFSPAPVTEEQIFAELPAVVKRTSVILDNYKSKDTLDYGDGASPIYAIAVGGNTLSRGLTLEGLVSSVFVRTAHAYDTLLQMGRWFGFRPGYADLPRIWTTEKLHEQFGHLASVEHGMRRDIELYQVLNVNPKDAAVRIRTHPALAITAKLGSAKRYSMSLVGRTMTTRYLHHADENILRGNLRAADDLYAKLLAADDAITYETMKTGSRVFNNVPKQVVTDFLGAYRLHPNSQNLQADSLRVFIERASQQVPEYLDHWTVAFISGSGSPVPEGSLKGFRTSVRSASDKQDDHVRIHTLTNPTDFGAGLGLTPAQLEERARKMLKDASITRRRNASDPTMLAVRAHDERRRSQGVLLVYPIDPESRPRLEPESKTRRGIGETGNAPRKPIDAAEGIPPIGIGIGFPDPSLSGGPDVSATLTDGEYMSVEIAGDAFVAAELDEIGAEDTEGIE